MAAPAPRQAGLIGIREHQRLIAPETYRTREWSRPMELTNDFRVSVPVEQAWKVLTDLERIAPCMPGAQLQEVEGDEYRGVVKVKVGPITAQYKGTARFLERDESARRAVLRAEGRDTRGQGTASATVTAVLTPDGAGTDAEGTTVSIVTDLAITGKVAQFGRGVLAEVSGRLLDQFAQHLESDVLMGDSRSASDASAPASATDSPSEMSGGSGSASGSSTSGSSASGSASAPGTDDGSAGADRAGSASAANGTSSTVRTLPTTPVEPVDLLGTAGPSLIRRVVPLLAGFAAVAVVAGWLRRRRTR